MEQSLPFSYQLYNNLPKGWIMAFVACLLYSSNDNCMRKSNTNYQASASLNVCGRTDLIHLLSCNVLYDCWYALEMTIKCTQTQILAPLPIYATYDVFAMGTGCGSNYFIFILHFLQEAYKVLCLCFIRTPQSRMRERYSNLTLSSLCMPTQK